MGLYDYSLRFIYKIEWKIIAPASGPAVHTEALIFPKSTRESPRAVDLTIIDEKGLELDMGTTFPFPANGGIMTLSLQPKAGNGLSLLNRAFRVPKNASRAAQCFDILSLGGMAQEGYEIVY
jgi:hypothetical protein